MDYFKQRRAYRNFKMFEANVSSGQNNLYRELLDYANDESKLDIQFRMKNSALISLTGLSEAGFDNARNKLVQVGLIRYVKGKKNVKAPEYQIINLYDNQSRTDSYPTGYPTTNKKSRSTTRERVGQPPRQGSGQTVEHKDLTGTDLDLTGTDHDEDDGAVTRSEVIDKWTTLWGFPNGIARPEIDEWFETLSPDIIDFAIQIAGEHNVQARGALKYIRAVIEGWQQRKITTLDQAKKASEEHDQRMANSQHSYSKPARTKETLPDWAQRDNDRSKTPTKKLSAEKQAELDSRIQKLRERNNKQEA